MPDSGGEKPPVATKKTLSPPMWAGHSHSSFLLTRSVALYPLLSAARCYSYMILHR